MSIEESLPSLTESLQAATEAVPSWDIAQPPEDGISLFDAKNEIFLTYLQGLALRNLDLIRDVREIVAGRKEPAVSSVIQDKVVDSLIRQRVYLERGVRPLEERLKYTVDKALRAAAESEPAQNGKAASANKAERSGSTSESASGSDSDDSSAEDTEEEETARPGAGKLQRGNQAVAEESTSKDAESSGAYRPPRMTATTMPEDFDRRRSVRKERPERDRTMEEYVQHELAEAPSVQPSVGSMIAQGGRRQISAREREKEAERREYEETHLTRLPAESKKEKARQAGRNGAFGGEDWRGLGEGLDRIDSLTRGVKRKGKESVLEKSRKRRATEDGQRQDGTQSGLFDKRKARLAKKLR